MQPSPSQVDCVIDARFIVPVEPAQTVLENHSLVISGGSITDLLRTPEARRRYDASRHLELGDHVLIPGLVNLHTHAAMTLLRGVADDVALMDWLNRHIWPAELHHVSNEFVYDGTRLACAEMLRGGITCFNDMYFFPRGAAHAAVECRMRAALGLIVVDFPSPYASDAQDYLDKGLALRDELREEKLLSFCFAPHSPYTVGDESLRQLAVYAGELDLPMHMHVHETRHEVEQSLKDHGVRPLRRLAQLGLLGPGLIGAHGIHLEPSEIDLLAQHGCTVAHCPTSNLKLASGIAPLKSLLENGVNVGLGTDGAASNNRLDMFGEMRLSALLAKGASSDATAVPAWRALQMATLDGARALGMEARIGSLRAGKAADIAAVRLTGPELAPCYDPLSHLVYAAGREHVSHVWVNGELVLDNGVLTTIDTREVMAKAASWRERIKTT